MNCADVRPTLDAYHDGELSEAERQALDAHIAGCADCAEKEKTMREIGERMRAVERPEAPLSLQERVRAELRRQDERQDRSGLNWRAWRNVAAAALLAAVVSSLATYLVMERGGTQAQTVDAVLSAHLRSLLADNLTQVASANPHNVKPWFAGKLPFAPRLRDFDQGRGFVLLGGRLDVVGERQVASFVLRRRAHVINVFVWPLDDGAALFSQRQASRRGYNLLGWSADGLHYWAVSDLNAAELSALPDLL